MRRIWLGLAIAVALTLVVGQVALPSYLSGEIEDRLTADGGHADVTLEAVPALRLLAQDGERIEMEGEGLVIDLEEPERRVFDKLDGFAEVAIRLRRLRADPFEVATFELTRGEGEEEYRLRIGAATSAIKLSRWAASRLGGPLAGIAAGLAGGSLPAGRESVPVVLDARLRSEDGRPDVVSGAGTIAGVPSGPLAELLAGAIAGRL